MKKRTKWFSAVIAGVLLLSLLAGCGSNSSGTASAGDQTADSGSGTEEQGGVFNFAVEEDVLSLDPAYGYSLSTSPAIHQMEETLLEYDADTKQLEPNLAESWEMTDDTTYVYHIRQGVKFWDGTDMTADDVVFSIQHIMDPDVASYMAFCYEKVVSVEATDSYTVTVKLSEPDSTFKYAVATDAGTVISKAYYEAHADTYGTSDGGVMGTGPYVYQSWIQGQQVTMSKNDNYWDTDHQPTFDQVNIVSLPESTTRLTAVETGQVQATFQVPTNQLEMVESMSNVSYKFNDAYSTHYISWNCQRAPFNDVNVRLALRYAFDTESYYNTYIKDAGQQGENIFVPPILRVYNDEAWAEAEEYCAQYTYDMDKAKECLANSSVPDGFEATIVVSSQDIEGRNAALQLQAAVKPLGITINIQSMTYGEMYALGFSAERDYDGFIMRWDCDYPDPATELIPTLATSACGEGGGNFPNYQNPAFDKLLEEQSVTYDEEERGKLLAEATKICADDAPFICFAYPYRVSVTAKNVGGYENVSPIYWWSTFTKYMYFTS